MNIIRSLLPFLLAFATTSCITVIEEGETGVRFFLGSLSEEPLSAGLKTYIPLLGRVERWNVKTQEVKESANVPSSEGLISTLDVSVLYRIPQKSAVQVRREVGRRFEDVLLVPNLRDTIRHVASGYAVKALFSDTGRFEIAQRMLTGLREKVGHRGIEIEDVLLRDIRLPETFSRSIEAKLRAEQESLQKEFELLKASKDAEIEVVRARGVAESNKIIAGSLSESYLRYRWIEGIQSNDQQVIYVPTEANLPVMEANRLARPKG